MRPDSIKKFDLFFLAAVGIAIASALLNWDQNLTAMREQLAGSGVVAEAGTVLFLGLAIGIGLGLLLWFLASRLRLGFARWLLILYVAYRALSVPAALSMGVGTLSITGLVTVLLQAIAVWFLFQPDAREWFASRKG